MIRSMFSKKIRDLEDTIKILRNEVSLKEKDILLLKRQVEELRQG